MRLLIGGCLLLFCILAFSDHVIQSRRQHMISTQPAAANAVRYAAGHVLYKAHCQTCHGKAGDGTGTFSGLTENTPRIDFTAPAFNLTRKEIKQVIAEGGAKLGKDPLMPAWKTLLTDQQIDQLAYFIFTVNREGGIRRKGKTLAADSRK